MKNRFQGLKGQMQRGFTLVELAIVLVIAGLILVGVLKGTDSVNKAKVERMVSDLRGLGGTLEEFHKRTGRYAGDCDNNGVLNNNLFQLTATNLPSMPAGWVANVLDDTDANRVMPPVAVAAPAANGTCTSNAQAQEADVNLVWNELRRAGVVDANRLPRELARHAMNDVFMVGSMTDNSVVTQPQMAGVIVVYGIPVWMAEAIDASLDGQATTYGAAAGIAAGANANSGAASTGRVRLWWGQGTNGTIAAGSTLLPHQYAGTATTASYDQGLNNRDRLVSISYQWTTEKLIH